MPKLSIITVNLNNAAGLRKTIESTRAQTFRDFEHIIIDGGSTDESASVIKEFESGFSYWVSEPDGGIYQGMNKGTKAAKGEYCLYLNSGDYLCNSKVLEKVFKEKFSEDLVYGDIIKENIKGQKKLFKAAPEEQINIITLLRLAFMFHSSLFIKREFLVLQNYYRVDFKNISDVAFFLESIILHGATLKYLSFAISIFCYNGVSALNSQLSAKERKIFYNELFGNRIIEKKIKDLFYLQEAFNLPFVKTYYRLFSFFKKKFQQIKYFLGIDFNENSMKYLYKQNNKPYYSDRLLFKNINFPNDKKIYIWGVGKKFNEILEFCKKKNLAIQAILDSDESLKGTSLQGKPVCSPYSVIKNLNNSVILICTHLYAEQIANECSKAGLIPNIDFFIPFKRLA